MAVRSFKVKIAGVGKYLPQRVITSTELENQLQFPNGWVERVTGIRSRRYAGGETVTEMAAAAARDALAMAGLQPSDLDAIIGASASTQQAIPCTAAFVQRALGAPVGKSMCFDVNTTCLGFVLALQNAACLIETGIYQTILIFSSEIGTYSRNQKQWESSVMFGDGAAAAVVTVARPDEASAIWHSRLVTYSDGADLTRLVGGGTLHHPNDPATTPEMNMFEMDGTSVLKWAAELLPPFVKQFNQELGWTTQDYQQVIPHQASGQGLKLLTSHVGFSPQQVFNHVQERGNCIAASIPLALAEAVESEHVRRGDRLLLLGTSAGLSIGALALTF